MKQASSLLFIIPLLGLLLSNGVSSQNSATKNNKNNTTSVIDVSLAGKRVPFVPNLGQWEDDSFDYLAKFGPFSEIAFDPKGWRLALLNRHLRQDSSGTDPEIIPPDGVLLRFQIVGQKSARLQPGNQLPGAYNYFVGEPKRWRTQVPLYAYVEYVSDNNVTVRLTSQDRRLFYMLDAKPGASLSQLKLRVDGVNAMEVAKNGALLMHTPVGTIVHSPPVAINNDGSKADTQAWHYVVDNLSSSFSVRPRSGGSGASIAASASGTQVAFSTLFGGGDLDQINASAEHVPGVVTSVGITFATLFGLDAFPTTPGAFLATHKPWTKASGLNNWPITHDQAVALDGSSKKAVDGFITQIRFDNKEPLGYGLGDDSGYGGPGVPFFGNPHSPFGTASLPEPPVAEMLFSTFVGSKANDYLEAVDVQDDGLITVAGYIEHNPFDPGAPDNDYPLTSNAAQKVFNKTYGDSVLKFAFREGIVSQFDPTKFGNDQLLYSTYYGGTYHDDIRSVVAHGKAHMTISGLTSSHDLPGIGSYSFDTTLGITGAPKVTAFPQVISNEYDGFIARIKPIEQEKGGSAFTYTGFDVGTEPPTKVAWATYLGGGDNPFPGTFDMITDMHIANNSPTGKITVVGRTDSKDFPVKNPIQAQLQFESDASLNWDAFIAQIRLDDDKMVLEFSTYLGGDHFDIVEGVAVDAKTGWIYIVGNTLSAHVGPSFIPGFYPSTKPFPTTPNAFDKYINDFSADDFYIPSCFPTSPPFFDSFVSIIDPETPALVASTYFGGVRDEIGTDIAVSQTGLVTITGWTHSPGKFSVAGASIPNGSLPVTMNAYDSSFNDGGPVLFDICGVGTSTEAADIFVARFNKDLSRLLYSTYLGAKQGDFVRDLHMSDRGTAVIAGHTYSNDSGIDGFPFVGSPWSYESFPTTPDAYNTNYTNANEAWGMHVNTYIGNERFNLGEAYVAAIEAPTQGIVRYGQPSKNCGEQLVTIDVMDQPLAGSSDFELSVVNAPELESGFFWVSTQGPQIPPLSWNDVKQWVKNPITVPAVTDANGIHISAFDLSTYLPDDQIWVQFVSPNPGCQAYAGNFVSSGALEITLQ